MYCDGLLLRLLPVFETNVMGGAGVKGGGARGNMGVVVIGVGMRHASDDLLAEVVLESASLIRVCTFEASTCI